VMGLEPCNCFVDGRTAPRNENVIDRLEPGETRCFDITIEASPLSPPKEGDSPDIPTMGFAPLSHPLLHPELFNYT